MGVPARRGTALPLTRHLSADSGFGVHAELRAVWVCQVGNLATTAMAMQVARPGLGGVVGPTIALMVASHTLACVAIYWACYATSETCPGAPASLTTVCSQDILWLLLPAVPGLAGIFHPRKVLVLRASFVIDYQNVHMTARDVFDPGGAIYKSLVHPVAFARRAVMARNERQRHGYPLATVERVLVYRGVPHVDYEWEQHRRCLDQASQWRSEDAIVELRDLKYEFERGADGRPILDVRGKKIPTGRPREKGIDVLCALACVRESAAPDVDLVVLASRDTDLVPVLDELHDLRGHDAERYARIETVSWYDQDASRQGRYAGGSLKPTGGRRIWNTNLDRSCYEASLDRRDYR